MPELPEVETIRRDLERLVVGRRIVSAKVVLSKLLRGYPEGRFKKRLIGRRLTAAGRRAKILILDLDSGDKLLVHLKMSGRFLYLPADAPTAKHTHLVFGLDNGHELRFVDMRQFGYFKLAEGGRLDDMPELKDLGPEPLAPGFSAAPFARLVESKAASRRPIKALLIDQTFLAGVGNLYADEILHAARVSPERRVSTLTTVEVDRIYAALRGILGQAIKLRGTSFDLYVDAEGRRGDYAKRLKVYGRSPGPCPRCGSALRKTRIAGRGTHYCPQCQK